MAETKYGKYVITYSKPGVSPADLIPGKEAEQFRKMTSVVHLDDEVVKGGFCVDCLWFWEKSDSAHPAHTHDFDQFLTFWGTNPENPHDLCGEVELWLEDEKHIITKSCLVFIPQGMKHGPMVIRKVDRPILHFSAGTSGKYTERNN